MKFIFHGGAREVGKSCIQLVTDHNDEYLFDAGIKFKHHGYEYPKILDKLKGLDGLFLSHAHLDHSGALPMFYHKRLLPNVFTTKLTISETKILLKDSYKIARIKHLHPAYEKTDLKKSIKKAKIVKFDKEYDYRNIKFKFLNAGHIPGSASVYLESDGKKILYTGDMNTRNTNLLSAADHSKYAGKLDVLIMESTYGDRKLPKTKVASKEMVESIKEVISKGGSVILPTFALGRAQELLIMLSELYKDKNFNTPIYFDGMCRKLTRKILVGPGKYLKHNKTLSKMYFKKVKKVHSRKQREKIASNKKPKIILTTSGMLQGGPVLTYIKNMWHNPKNAIFLVGYQCKSTNGRLLLEKNFVYIKGWKTEVKCQVKQFSFSGHLGMEQIFDYLKMMKPKHLIVQHGDPPSVDNVVEWAKKNIPDTKVYGPKVGDVIEI